LILAALDLAACDWSLHRMQDQPRCTAYAPTALLPGGSCNLEPPDGVVALGAAAAAPRPPLTAALITRGRDRFERFCAPCHGPTGDGDSDVARAMRLRPPPSLYEERIARQPDLRLEAIVARGYGLMPAYGDALAPDDRWAVVTFVRVLEARVVQLDQLAPHDRQEALAWLR
jgi:mono/diheme cytochrome c family protein